MKWRWRRPVDPMPGRRECIDSSCKKMAKSYGMGLTSFMKSFGAETLSSKRGKNDNMDLWDLKKWRRTLKYSQFDAATALGVSRSAVQHWESGTVPISRFVELACDELTQRWKQRSESGPATLIYAAEAIWPGTSEQSSKLFVQCELLANNEVALQRVWRLRQTNSVLNAFIIVNEHAEIVWSGRELLNECDGRGPDVEGCDVSADHADD
jgi:DNA-binding transcriptional regulator YiaG